MNSFDNNQWQVESVSYPGGQLQIITGFDRPYGVTVTTFGTLYVSDLGEGRVVRFTSKLSFFGWLGMIEGEPNSASGWHDEGQPAQGSEAGMLNMPHSVDFDRNGNIYVADYISGRIHKYSADGTYLGLFFDPPSAPELAFDGPANAHFDNDYNLWVSDFDLHRIMKFSPDGSFVGWMGEKDDGTPTNGFATSGAAEASTSLGGFFRPHMVRIDRNNNIIVVETGNHRIQKFSSTGVFLGWIGAKRDGTLTDGWETSGLSQESNLPGGFKSPVSLQLIDNDTMIIADNGNHRIQKFDPDGRFVAWMGGKSGGGITSGWETEGESAAGTEPGMFTAPYDALWQNGRLYVADGHNSRVQIFHLDKQD